MVSSTGPNSAPLAFTWIIDHPAQDGPLVGVQIARGPLLDADEVVARQQAVGDLSQLAGISDREALQDAYPAFLPD
jgi:hypothetical protein